MMNFAKQKGQPNSCPFVEKRRLERPTPTSRTWCATNCATSRNFRNPKISRNRLAVRLFPGRKAGNPALLYFRNKSSAFTNSRLSSESLAFFAKRLQRYCFFRKYANKWAEEREKVCKNMPFCILE